MCDIRVGQVYQSRITGVCRRVAAVYPDVNRVKLFVGTVAMLEGPPIMLEEEWDMATLRSSFYRLIYDPKT